MAVVTRTEEAHLFVEVPVAVDLLDEALQLLSGPRLIHANNLRKPGQERSTAC